MNNINTGDVLIEFHSTTCGICRKMSPLVNKLIEAHKETRFVDLLTDDEEHGEEIIELADKFNVATLPTFIHLINGQVVGQTHGFHTLTDLENKLLLK